MVESLCFEYEEVWRDEYLKWICGLANAEGGKIYIGMRDDGSIAGVEDAERLMVDIPNKALSTLGIIVKVDRYGDPGKEYIEITVNPSSSPISYHGEYHYRTGTTKQLLTGPALNQFLLDKGGTTWDALPADNVTVDDLDNDAFAIFREEALASNRMGKKDIEESNEQILNRLGLIDEQGRLRKAAVLLFHANPERWVPGSYIKIGYFQTDADLKYQDELHGSLMSQVRRVMDLIYTKYLKANITYRGITRIETFPFPEEAIREAVINAIVHKYYPALIPIQISIYEDKLYIANDCMLPREWTAEDLLKKHRSRPYNPTIANTFFRAGFIESWGRGIEKIIEACKASGNPMPEYSVKQEEIMVRFDALDFSKVPEVDENGTLDEESGTLEPIDGTLDEESGALNIESSKTPGDLEEQVLSLLRNHPKATALQICETLNLAERSTYRLLNKLKSQGKIKRIGGKRFGYWEICD